MKEIKVPDLEGSENVAVVEVYVSAGDNVEIESPLISLESDKAVMDVPSPITGVIQEVKINEGDTVNAGDLIVLVTEQEGSTDQPDETTETAQSNQNKSEPPSKTDTSDDAVAKIDKILVPDLEGSEDVAVVEIYVSVGETVETESPLISLESDKAVMDVPSPFTGVITDIGLSVGDTVNTGDLIGSIRTLSSGDSGKKEQEEKGDRKQSDNQEVKKQSGNKDTIQTDNKSSTSSSISDSPVNSQAPGALVHATPSIRSMARELGVDLSKIAPTGPKGRITRNDLTTWIKDTINSSPKTGSVDLPAIPTDDFASYGPVETVKLGRIKKISGPHLHKNWLGIPHVTQFEDADITELEAFRKTLNVENTKKGLIKISPLIIIIKAVVKALQEFPDFNSSLNPDASTITLKKYYNIGIAVDTPGGLVVPVIQNADRKGILELAEELADLSSRAREGKLKAGDMKGSGFTISSLGGIGGTYFTPIVNAPEVAILGLSRSSMKPVWNGSEFTPRLILPISVSYDHRVIDGAQGARFAVYLAGLLSDLRRVLV